MCARARACVCGCMCVFMNVLCFVPGVGDAKMEVHETDRQRECVCIHVCMFCMCVLCVFVCVKVL